MSQRDLAARLDCSVAYLRALEHGEGEHSGEIILRTARVLNVDVSEMGQLLSAGGYVSTPGPPEVRTTTFLAALGDDPGLSKEARRLLSETYDLLVAPVVADEEGSGHVAPQRDEDPGDRTDSAVSESEVRRPVLYSVNDIAGILQVSTKTVRRLIKDGELRHLRIGRAIRISDEHLDEYLYPRPRARKERPAVRSPGDSRYVKIVPRSERKRT